MIVGEWACYGKDDCYDYGDSVYADDNNDGINDSGIDTNRFVDQ